MIPRGDVSQHFRRRGRGRLGEGMLRVEDVYVVRHKVLVEGLSRRQATRAMGTSRNTVRSYLTLAELVRVALDLRRKPVLERVQPRLEARLEEWSGRTTAKQRLTATRLHRQLREGATRSGTRWCGTTCASADASVPRCSTTSSRRCGRPLLRPEPGAPFEARRVRAVSVSGSALVRVEGARYSAPSRWAGLRATALIGTDELTLRCRGEEVAHPPVALRRPPGGLTCPITESRRQVPAF